MFGAMRGRPTTGPTMTTAIPPLPPLGGGNAAHMSLISDLGQIVGTISTAYIIGVRMMSYLPGLWAIRRPELPICSRAIASRHAEPKPDQSDKKDGSCRNIAALRP